VIPRADVTAWRAIARWPSDAQVEQDLVSSRALVALFADPTVARSMAFRGGTALHKLFLERPGRYSEDIDLVQVDPGAIGPALGAIRSTMDPWLGQPKWAQGHGRVTLVYRFETTSRPVQQMRLKLEVNTREHFTVLGLTRRDFGVRTRWFTGEAGVTTYQIEELLGTKLRALYQRRKGRDLFDLWLALTSVPVDEDKVVECFSGYLAHDGATISRAELEANLSGKLEAPAFLADLHPLLPAKTLYDPHQAAGVVRGRLLARLPGAPWKGAGA